MDQFNIIDGAIIVGYLTGVPLLGLWVSRRIRTLSDFFMPRRFGKSMMIMHAFGTGTASDHAVTIAAATFREGPAGIWYQWLWLFSTPFYWIIAPVMRRFRALTTADVFALRFNESVAVLFAIVGIVGMAVKIGVMLKGSSSLLDAVTGGMIDSSWAIGLLSLVFVTYGAAGGLSAIIFTDFIQGTLTVLFSILLLPFVVDAAGGFEAVRSTVLDPERPWTVLPGRVGIFFVLMYSVQALVGVVAQPHVMGVCGAGKTEMDGRVGFTLGNFLKRLCTVAWWLTALAGVAWYAARREAVTPIEPDQFYGLLAREFLPQMAPGLLGLFVAATLATIMSSCDSFMIASSALFTENIYRRLKPHQTVTHYLWIGRFAAICVVAGGVLVAFRLPNVVQGLEIWLRIAPLMGVSFWMGLVWSKTTAAGAWASTCTGFLSWFLLTRTQVIDFLADNPLAEALGLVWREAGVPVEVYEPWEIAITLGAAVAAGVVVSLLSTPPDAERLKRFHELIDTPMQDGEPFVEACRLPAGVTPQKKPILIQWGGLRVPALSRTSMRGFLLSWLAVAVLIGAFWAFVNW